MLGGCPGPKKPELVLNYCNMQFKGDNLCIQVMNNIIEQEKKGRLKNGTLVVGKATFTGDNPEVSFKHSIFLHY